MTVVDFYTFLTRLADGIDPDELVDILGLTTRDIVNAFPEQIEAARQAGHLTEMEDA